MINKNKSIQNGKYDILFLQAEILAKDFSLYPELGELCLTKDIQGLLSEEDIENNLERLQKLDIDRYIDETIRPTESKNRKSGKSILKKIWGKPEREESYGPLYMCEYDLDFEPEIRRVGFIVQDRHVKNGVWAPKHHTLAIKKVRECAKYSMPIVTCIDTPGASANEDANIHNQAHSISNLIAEMSQVDVPSVGIILGNGYSGGAIPLATTNSIFAVRDAVFNTIQPPGLAAIVRRYGLSWQECAKYVGVSSFELFKQGYIDGIIDYVPGETDEKLDNFRKTILSSIQTIETYTKKFIQTNEHIVNHYQKSVQRFIQPSKKLHSIQNVSDLSLAISPTEYPNVFGIGYRHLRYLTLRKRITSIHIGQYGILAKAEIPKGELEERTRRECQHAFFSWIQNPDKIIYDETLQRSWKNYKAKKENLIQPHGWISRHIFGEPQHNYENARFELLFSFGFYLFNRWKTQAQENFLSLISYLENYRESYFLFRVGDLLNIKKFLMILRKAATPLDKFLLEHFSYKFKKFLSEENFQEHAQHELLFNLTFELNQIIQEKLIYTTELFSHITIPKTLLDNINNDADKIISNNRKLLEVAYPNLIKPREIVSNIKKKDLSILDIIINKKFREDFIKESQYFVLFNDVYNTIVTKLGTVAYEASKHKHLSQETITNLIESAFEKAAQNFSSKQDGSNGDQKLDHSELKKRFFTWIKYFTHHTHCRKLLKSVEEWKKNEYPRISDTLFVIVTNFFEKLLPELFYAQSEGRKYKGKINPKRIGRKKDFWYRLTIAYNDLLIHNILLEEKKKNRITPSYIIDRFFNNFVTLNDSIITADPAQFPGFRSSIEKSLSNKITPCGVITGIGDFKTEKSSYKVGAIISNIDFQAGAFDMASAEKVCKLLVECAIRRIPIVGFISSGGMQTKEGAGSLFSMAIINDRFTRFIRDNDLPIVIFGFGDCTGGAQASFVTHPVVQTYYFSGTNMPFAGQIVVPSYLPTTATLSNYLSVRPGSMQGLVKHPFRDALDKKLQSVDPNIPLPTESVEQVMQKIMDGIFLSKTEKKPLQKIPALKKKDIMGPVKRVLIHARGCTAVKVITTAQRMGIEVVLVQSDPDMDSLTVDILSEKDQVVCIGGNTPEESYLNALSVLKVAENENVDALHPGIGFLSENSRFAELCKNHRINFIGPSIHSLEIMGNKSNAIHTAMSIGVPVVPGSHGVIIESEKAAQFADSVGFPVLLKAVHGGGGKGIQVVESSSQIHDVFKLISKEAKSAFGNGEVYLEKYITTFRHIEVQVLRDCFGHAKILGLRDCSVQRNNQKIIEESGSLLLTDSLKEKAFCWAERIVEKIDYVGAGTVEFIFDLTSQELYFMEMNTRLQVEHPVTEMVSGIDIIETQFQIAGKESIADMKIQENGYAMEVRINAEKAVYDSKGEISFQPTPGTVTKYEFPEDDSILAISMIAEGKKVSPFYDNLVIQLICHGTTRRDTIQKLRDYLEKVSIEGICTNIPLLKKILSDTGFIEGKYSTEYLTHFLKTIDTKEFIEEIEIFSNMKKVNVDQNSLKIEGTDEIRVLSPSSGVFYASPTPQEDDFVKVGDAVSVDDTLCLLEAMKLFTPFSLGMYNTKNDTLYPNERKYKVVRVHNVSGQQVNMGDLLFVIKPEPTS